MYIYIQFCYDYRFSLFLKFLNSITQHSNWACLEYKIFLGKWCRNYKCFTFTMVSLTRWYLFKWPKDLTKYFQNWSLNAPITFFTDYWLLQWACSEYVYIIAYKMCFLLQTSCKICNKTNWVLTCGRWWEIEGVNMMMWKLETSSCITGPLWGKPPLTGGFPY